MASDIVDLILQHLSAQDLCHVERVCHRLRSLGRDSAAWRTCFEAQYKDAGANPPAAEEPESLNWKQAYRAAYAEEKRRNNWKLKAKTFKLTSDLQARCPSVALESVWHQPIHLPISTQVLERHIQHAFASIRGINTLLKQKEDELQALQSARCVDADQHQFCSEAFIEAWYCYTMILFVATGQLVSPCSAGSRQLYGHSLKGSCANRRS